MFASIAPKLPMVDPRASQAFYENILGFTTTGDYGDYLLLQREQVEIHLFSFPTLDPAKSDFMAYIRIDADIDALYADIQARGGQIHPNGPLEAKPWGVKEFVMIDPSGTCLTFGQLG